MRQKMECLSTKRKLWFLIPTANHDNDSSKNSKYVDDGNNNNKETTGLIHFPPFQQTSLHDQLMGHSLQF